MLDEIKENLLPKYTKIYLKQIHFFCLKWSPIVCFHPKWVKDVHGAPIDLGNPKDIDRVHLCRRPSQTIIQFIHIKAYKNHLKVA
jgi:hypothetical protein